MELLSERSYGIFAFQKKNYFYGKKGKKHRDSSRHIERVQIGLIGNLASACGTVSCST